MKVRQLLLIAVVLVAIISLPASCLVPRTFYRSAGPDGQRSIRLRTLYIVPDWTLWIDVTEGWTTKNIYTSGDVPEPGYAEAFWVSPNEVLILECGSFTVYGYRFDRDRIMDETTATFALNDLLAKRRVKPIAKDNGAVQDFIEPYCNANTSGRT